MRLIDRRKAGAALALLSIATLSGPGSAADPPLLVLGETPAGARSIYHVSDVHAEVCRRQIFPAAAVGARMPDGFRLARLSERISVPWVAELLRRRPELRDHANGNFCLIEAGVHLINGAPVHPGRISRVAFLWADMVPTGAAPADPRFRGPMTRVQLFWMYDSEGVDRDLALSVTPNALFGRINMERSGTAWRVAIDAEGSTLAAEVTPTTARRRVDYPTPAYETVALSDAARDHFTVITFMGHHEQIADGEWRVTGDAAWARSFVPEASTSPSSIIWDSLSARSGLYRHAQP